VQDLLERLFSSGPVRGGVLVSREAGAALVFPDRGVQHRDGFGERDGDIGVSGGLPGRLGCLPLELDEPFGGGVGLGGFQPGQVVDELWVAAKLSAKFGPGLRIDLLVYRDIRHTFDDLASGEAESLGSGSPPPAGRLPGLSGIDVIAAESVLRAGLALGLPDIAEVVALGDGDDHGQTAASFPRSRRPRD
jgi:hypothetical protein